ncbi:putative programmed cell death protein [Scheffersomyces amazonensis]|uniref:putative programmed cell death protein n=1 Tax=Scheffersomyces amazonensis TaxID=1078765 RepID=UPI00315D5E41
MDDAELTAIRQARLAELQKNAANPSSSSGGAGGAGGNGGALDSALAQILEPSARERLSRVRIVRPERAQQVEQYILQLYRNGAINRKLTEQDIVQILDGLSRDSNQKQSSKIIFDRKPTDLDNDLEDDDDDFFD